MGNGALPGGAPAAVRFAKPASQGPEPRRPQSTAKGPEQGVSPGKEPHTVRPGVTANIDSLSIASDESSGSNNSENSLPRIIKPRKRRKKDRKPPIAGSVADRSQGPEDGGPRHGLQPVPELAQQQKQYQHYGATQRFSGEHYYRPHRRGPAHCSRDCHDSAGLLRAGCPPSPPANGASPPRQEVFEARQQPQQQQQQQQNRFVQRHAQVKVLDDNRNVVLPGAMCQAKVQANFVQRLYPRSGLDDASQECPAAVLCQCRYCEPAALVWDVAEQNAYSPRLLGPPHQRYAQVQQVFVARPFVCPEHGGADIFDAAEAPCVALRSRPEVLLRRSWSDPTSYFSDEVVPQPARHLGVIGDRGQSADALKGSWRGDASTPPSPGTASADAAQPGGPLEVSTEIVTSANGHRDLEIKFYSSPAAPEQDQEQEQEGARTRFALPEAEEPGDIWSYHEFQLQQDFRTLLQAEE